jgi:RimJ/RimL family protein N-acetyltransferase
MAEAGAIETARLILRPASAQDLPWICAVMNTPSVMRYLAGVRACEAVAAGLAADIAAFAAPAGHRRWTVWLCDGLARVGRVGLFRVRSPTAPPALHGQREIGWTFAETQWGIGYATEAAKGALGFAFGVLGLPRVWSQTSGSNLASTRMMLRLGFTFRPELGYVDLAYPAADNPITVWSQDAPPLGRDA